VANINEVFSQNLKVARKLRGYTQQEVADGAAVSLSSYKQIELGNAWPQKETISKIATFLKVDEEILFSGSRPMTTDDMLAMMVRVMKRTQNLDDEMLELLSGLSQFEVGSLKEYLKRIADKNTAEASAGQRELNHLPQDILNRLLRIKDKAQFDPLRAFLDGQIEAQEAVAKFKEDLENEKRKLSLHDGSGRKNGR
jgi:transcriptional regulator with XRE-family HTH domain